MKKENHGHQLRSFFTPFVVVLAVGITLFVFWLKTNTTRPTAGNQNNSAPNVNQGDQGTSLTQNDTVSVQSVLVSEDSSISGALYVVKEKSLFRHDVSSGTEELVQKVEESATGLFSYHSQNGDVAYVRTNGDFDEFVFVGSVSREPAILQKAYHGYTGTDEVQNSVLRSRPRFSRSGQYLVVEKTFWEWCRATIFDLKTKQVVTERSCNALFWSPDDSRVIEATSFGIDTGPKLMINIKATTDDFFEVDWSTVSGDIDLIYDRQSRTLKTGFVAAQFLSNDEVLLLTDRDEAQRVRLFSYEIGDKVLKSRALLPTISNPRITVVGNIALIAAFEGVFGVDLEKGVVNKLVIENLDLSSAEYELEPLANATAVLSMKKFDDRGNLSESKIFAVDPADRTYKKVSEDIKVSFAGV